MNMTKFRRRIGFSFGRGWFICFNFYLILVGFWLGFFSLKICLCLLFPVTFSNQWVCFLQPISQLYCSTVKDVQSITGQRSGLVVWNSKRWQFIQVGDMPLHHPSIRLSQPQGRQRLVHKGFLAACVSVVSPRNIIIQTLKPVPDC